jgi:general secretion pathway protein M
MIDRLTDRQRQLLALAILVLVTSILVTITVVPLWIANRHYMRTIESLDDRLVILQMAAATGSKLQSQHEQLKRLLANDRHYLKSASEALASANLQGIINRIAGSKGMEVLSTQILPARAESEFTRVAIKVRMRGTLDNLVTVIYALETGQPYLFLDNISIRTRRLRSSNDSIGQMLDVDFDLIGYMLGQT